MCHRPTTSSGTAASNTQRGNQNRILLVSSSPSAPVIRLRRSGRSRSPRVSSGLLGSYGVLVSPGVSSVLLRWSVRVSCPGGGQVSPGGAPVSPQMVSGLTGPPRSHRFSLGGVRVSPGGAPGWCFQGSYGGLRSPRFSSGGLPGSPARVEVPRLLRCSASIKGGAGRNGTVRGPRTSV